ncbi:uncharacterized protein TNCV_4932281 [Trichonephila clavipes]|nr:uncharacterized protein TNCV_4932281 [Trichonephila clavipes]
MLVLVHIDITPPHTPLPVFRQIGERTIPYSWRACKQLRHLCETALRSNGLFASIFDGLVAFAVDRLRHHSGTRRVRFFSTARDTNEGRKVRSGYLPFRTRVLYRSHQNDRLRVMLVLVHIDITPPQTVNRSMFGIHIYHNHRWTHISGIAKLHSPRVSKIKECKIENSPKK